MLVSLQTKPRDKLHAPVHVVLQTPVLHRGNKASSPFFKTFLYKGFEISER